MPQTQLRTMIGPSVRTILSQLIVNASPLEIDQMESAFRISYDKEGWTKTTAFCGVIDTLQSLAGSGARLFIFTNKPTKVTMQILRRLKIHSLFQEVVSRDSKSPVHASKKEILRSIIECQSVDPGHAVVVGDSIEDLSAARATALPFFFANYGYGDLQLTEMDQDVCVLEKFTDLLMRC